MPSCRWYVAIVLLLLQIPLFSLAANCQEASIEYIILTNDETDLILYFSVVDCFSPKLEQAILNGLPVTFRFHVDLYKKRSFWYDKLLESSQISHSMEYDLLKKEFHVTLEERKSINHTTRDFQEAKRLMADVDRFSVIPMEQLEKNQGYYLRIRAKLAPIRLPFYLDFFLFFVPKWEFETKWFVKEFIY
ncbi:MAG: DUF4390 domain-containing protein [Deltaproteobacteria bacterium]|nr:DUF4390 domain-containing protein [Deltaproteobacteria bacterium]MBW2307507.1 DUF4390 domain-containing protein [Deltaproteobacteria bacterium]